jgi:transcriptional regulator with XRE-family HTH domain
VVDPPHAVEYVKLGRALARLRRKAGLTQVQAGARIGLRPQFVSEVENGRRGMRWHTLTATVRAYGATLADLAREFERE